MKRLAISSEIHNYLTSPNMSLHLRTLVIVALILTLTGCKSYTKNSVDSQGGFPQGAAPERKDALLARSATQLEWVTEQEAINELDFAPVYPKAFPADINPDPQIAVSMANYGQPVLEINYSSNQNAKKLQLVITEGRSTEKVRPGFGTGPIYIDGRIEDIAGTQVSIVSIRERNQPVSELETMAAWEHRKIAYLLRLFAPRDTSGRSDTTTREKTALMLVEGLITAANQR